MTNRRLLSLLAGLAAAVLFLGSQPANAQSVHQLKFRVLRSGKFQAQARNEKKVLQQLASGFGVLPPLDDSGNDMWPCFPGGGNPNDADCASIAAGGMVLGQIAYTQSLSSCNANASDSPNCGQIFWFYEDDTGNNTDNLVVSVVVKQGKNYILDTGAYNFGPNPFPAGSVVTIYDDTAFGTLGQPGPSNGFCAGSTETCVNPVRGSATVTITTTVGTSTIISRFNMFFE